MTRHDQGCDFNQYFINHIIFYFKKKKNSIDSFIKWKNKNKRLAVTSNLKFIIIFWFNINKYLFFVLNIYFFILFIVISLFSNDIIKLTKFIKFNYLNIKFFYFFKIIFYTKQICLKHSADNLTIIPCSHVRLHANFMESRHVALRSLSHHTRALYEWVIQRPLKLPALNINK
jgi:hypothetical protein